MIRRAFTPPALSTDPAAVGLPALNGIHVDAAEGALWTLGFAPWFDVGAGPDSRVAAPTDPSKLPAAATSLPGLAGLTKLPTLSTVLVAFPVARASVSVARASVSARPPVTSVTIAAGPLAARRPAVVTVATVRLALALARETTGVEAAVTREIEEERAVGVAGVGATRCVETLGVDCGCVGATLAGCDGVLGRGGDAEAPGAGVAAGTEGADGAAEVTVEVADATVLVG
jgi:hypothetical protein